MSTLPRLDNTGTRNVSCIHHQQLSFTNPEYRGN